MKIKDQYQIVAKSEPVCCAPSATAYDAITAMCDKKVGSVVVIHSDRSIAGIVTERDMMTKILYTKANIETTQLAEIMTTDVRIANENDDLLDWMYTMLNDRFKHLPVVDEHGKLSFVISQGDLLAHTWPDLYEKIKKDLKGRLAGSFQAFLFVFALITLGLIAFGL